MAKLNKHKFSDLYEMSSGISSKPEQAGHGSPFLSFSTVFNNYFIPGELDEKMNTSEEEQKKYSIKKGDIFLTRTSETLDELGMSSVALEDYPNATYSGFLKRLRPLQDNVTYHKYLAFYLRSYLFRKSMNYKAVMTLRASLNEKIFSYIDLYLPEYDQQRMIGDFLSSLFQKIEINELINKKIEEQITLIYQYWFVQHEFPDLNGKPYKSNGGAMIFDKQLKREIPKNWSVKNLGEVANVRKGELITAKTADKNGNIKVVSAGLEHSYFHSKSNRNANTITISASGANAGYINYWYEPIFACDCTTVTSTRDVLTLIIHEFLKLRQEYISGQSKGSAQPHVYPKDISALKIALPPNEVIEDFEKIILGMNKMIIKNVAENKKLEKIKELLLPLFVNGELRINNLKTKSRKIA